MEVGQGGIRSACTFTFFPPLVPIVSFSSNTFMEAATGLNTERNHGREERSDMFPSVR